MRFIKWLILGIIIGAVGYWYVQRKAQQNPSAEQRFKDSAAKGEAAASSALHNFSDAFKSKLDTLNLHGDQIEDEMARTGKVVRSKAQEIAGKVADATSDARAVAAIKAKYAGDKDLSVWSISVSCSDGHVALAGTVPNSDGIGQAVALALEVDGVQDVTSTLKVKPKN
jgi:hypothetical protein